MIIRLAVFACLLLATIALVTRRAALRESKRSGLPAGDLLYSDTGAPVGRIAPLTMDAHGARQEKPLVSQTFELTGRPDYLIEVEEGVVPVEAKSTVRPPSGRPYDSHVAQLAAYCLLVEDVLKASVPYGIIKYRDGEIRVEYTHELRNHLLTLLDGMRVARAADDVHRSHDEARRCRNCSLRDVCDEALS